MNKSAVISRLKQDLFSRDPAVLLNNSDQDFTDFTRFNDYPLIEKLEGFYENSDYQNPYFMAREGTLTNTVQYQQDEYDIYSGYNYLGLSHHPKVIEAAAAAIKKYGTHSGAARIVGGEIPLHRQLEDELARFCGHEDCVVGVGGYSINVSTLGYLVGRRDLIIHDALMHNSGVAGATLSGARRMAFAHNDCDSLEELLEENRSRYQRVIILIEGAYSMDGDIPDLPRIIELKQRYKCWLMVDEAHSYGTLGATGRGICEYYDIDPGHVDISMGTLSKSFASCGGFITGSQPLIDMLRYFAPGIVLYSTGIPPASTAASLAALQVIKEEPQRVQQLQHNVRRFLELAKERKLNTGFAKDTPIVPVLIGDTVQAITLMSEMLEAKIMAHAVMYPTVPRNEARLRFFISSEHTEEQFIHVLDTLSHLMSHDSP